MSDSEPNDSYKDVFALIAGKSLEQRVSSQA
jgi:hypothetical protein